MKPSMILANETFRLKLMYNAESPAPLGDLVCAKYDSAAFQIILNSPNKYSVTSGLHDWYSARNHMFRTHHRLRVDVECPFETEINIEDFVTDDDNTSKADVLLTTEVRESDANVPSAVWVQINVPKDAVAGTYPVKINLYNSTYNTDEELIESADAVLKVFDYTLPDYKDFKFHLDLWQHNSNIARKFEVGLFSYEHFTIIEKFAKSLAELGQKSITVCASEIPWVGQECYKDHKYGGNLFEYSMIGIERDESGKLVYDYSKMQRYIDICTAAGISEDIEIIGLVNIWCKTDLGINILCNDYVEPIRLRYYDRNTKTLKYVRSADEIRDYIKSLETYFIETNQIDRVRIGADEPGDIEKYRRSISEIQTLAPSFRFKTAINHASFIGEFSKEIDDYSPYLKCVFNEYNKLVEYQNTLEGKKFLWYVCCGNTRPNTFLRSNLTDSRFIGILTDYLKFDGFLRWNYTVWPKDPRHDIRYGVFEAGDTNFVYPSNNGSVLLSLRYKNLQRGICDFEIIKAAREKHGNEVVDKLIKKVIFTSSTEEYCTLGLDVKNRIFSDNFDDFNSLKEELLSLLSE